MPFFHRNPRDPSLPPPAWWQNPWVRRFAGLIPGIGPGLSAGLAIGSNIHDRHLRDHLGQPIYGNPGFGFNPHDPYSNFPGGGFGLNNTGGYGSTGGSSYGSGQGFGNGLAQLPGGTDQFGLPTGPVNLNGGGGNSGSGYGGGSNGLGQLGQPGGPTFGSNPLIGMGFVDLPTQSDWQARALPMQQ